MQHVSHRKSDEIHALRAEIERLKNEIKKWQVLANQGLQIERELRAEIERLRNTIQNCPPVSESEYVRRLEADIVRLEAIVASGKLDPSQVWPS